MARTVLQNPEICLSTADEFCRVTPPEWSVVKERASRLPEGYSKTMVEEIQKAYPDKFGTMEEAYMVFDVVKAVIANGLKNMDVVDLEGLGEFRVEPGEGGIRQVVFTPEPGLNTAIKESKQPEKASGERAGRLPDGYSKTMVLELQRGYPDKFKSIEEAYMAFDVMRGVIIKGLIKKDTVDVEGLGEFRADSDSVTFKSETGLTAAINESRPHEG